MRGLSPPCDTPRYAPIPNLATSCSSRTKQEILFSAARFKETAARSAGAWGNNLLVATCPSANAFEQTTTTAQQVNGGAAAGATSVTVDTDATNYLNVGDIVEFSSTGGGTDFTTGEQYRLTAVSATSITLVQHPRGAGGLITAVVDDARIKRNCSNCNSQIDRYEAA